MKFTLKPREAGARLGVGSQTVCRWAAAGKIRAFRTPSGRYLFAEEDVEAFAAKCTLEPDEAKPAVAS